MKRFVVLATLVALSGHGAHAMQRGTVGGGGGDTLPVDRASIAELSDMVSKARMQLVLYFNYVERMTESFSDYNPAYKDLFKRYPQYEYAADRNNNIIAKVARIQITEKKNGPCYDEQNNPKDGSSSSSPTQGESVCISTYNLSKQLSITGAEVHVAALVAHEYAHLAGADEAQAVEIQRDVLKNLSKSSYDSAHNYWQKISNGMFAASLTISKIEEAQDWQQACSAAERLVEDLRPLFTETVMGLYAVTDVRGTVLSNTLYSQVMNIAIGTCAFSPNSQWAYLRQRYEKAYGMQLEISTESFQRQLVDRFEKRLTPRLATVPRITDETVLKKELKRLDQFLNFVDNTIQTPLWNGSSNK